MALRVERDEKISTAMSELQEKITSPTSTNEEKNTAFEELQVLNLAKGKETYLEDKILNNFKIKSFIEINNDMIDKILDRKNELIRPDIANVDQILLVFAAKEPDFSFYLLFS